jgi:pheromone shutdown-related protein TraB
MENLTPVSENSAKIILGDREIHIVGTAHVSRESRDEVRDVIEGVDPDTVCVELDEGRYHSLRNQDRWKNLDIVKVLREKKGFMLFANMVLSSFQKKIGLELESAPGAEMIEAIDLAESKGKQLVLADRDINLTLSRAWGLSSFWDKMKIMSTLLDAVFTNEEVKKEDIQGMMKGEDVMAEMMGVFAEKLPMAKRVLIDERDAFLAHRILTAPGKKIVAVVGKGHLRGILARIEADAPYDASIEEAPKSGIIGKIIPWVIIAAVLALLVLGFVKGFQHGGLAGGANNFFQMLIRWVLVNGIFTAVPILFALANPLTLLSCFVIGPFLRGRGIMVALVEATVVKPQVKDFESLPQDMTSFKGFFKNRVTHILLVMVLGTIGAWAGTFVGIPMLTSFLGGK